MSDNVFTLDADAKLRGQIDALVDSLFGPTTSAAALIVEGRAIPNIGILREDDKVVFVLDHRLAFEFPKEWAHQAACFAANAMAIGAGYAHLTSETRDRPFAPGCIGIEGIELPGEPA